MKTETKGFSSHAFQDGPYERPIRVEALSDAPAGLTQGLLEDLRVYVPDGCAVCGRVLHHPIHRWQSEDGGDWDVTMGRSW